MFFEENENSKKTKQLLLSILEYCSSNNLKFWMEDGYFHKFYVAGKIEFNRHLNNKKTYSPSSIEVTPELINNDYYDIFFGGGNSQMNTSISPIPEWAVKNQKEYNELYVHVFRNNEKDITEAFAQHWLNKESFNLAHALTYRDKKYPESFADRETFKKPEKNWIYFLSTISDDFLVDFWEDHQKLEDYRKALKEFGPEHKSYPNSSHSFLRTLTNRICEHHISEDAKLRSAYLIMDVFENNKEFQGFYAKKFPFIATSLNNAHKESLFPLTESEIVEKVVFPKNHIYDYFKHVNLDAEHYINLSVNALSLIGKHEELKNNGLISIDVVNHKSYEWEKDNLAAYITLTDNTLMNKAALRNLYINIMESVFTNDEVIKSIKEDNFNEALFKTIANQTISHWVLNKQLPNKAEKAEPKKKMKL